MAAEPDDDALTWGGSADPSYLDSPVAESPVDDEPPENEPRNSSAILVSYGVFGGIFLLYVVGWIIAVQKLALGSSGILAQVMDRLAEFLALLSPALWFFGVLMLIGSDRARSRIVWLALGVILLAPWPFFFGL